jgi:hypothetical protein
MPFGPFTLWTQTVKFSCMGFLLVWKPCIPRPHYFVSVSGFAFLVCSPATLWVLWAAWSYTITLDLSPACLPLTCMILHLSPICLPCVLHVHCSHGICLACSKLSKKKHIPSKLTATVPGTPNNQTYPKMINMICSPPKHPCFDVGNLHKRQVQQCV